MRLFKTKSFAAFANKKGIDDSVLIDAVERAEKGLIDADLGGNVIKQRIAKQGQGRSSGYRALIFYKIGQKYFFASIFEKNNRENITKEELSELKKLAKIYLHYSDETLAHYIKQQAIIEIFV
ncbi:type II toxin-antitoxin system RelE/ParE family toxin [Lonepinella sp. MS14437]|uniref:type II toxin-antitoxin system RelE/ParE family toxin n=1 Tax=unclassified Lonepinella TaxID=2642006 RepID=UPI0036DDD62D